LSFFLLEIMTEANALFGQCLCYLASLNRDRVV
jgi:hypothetical protein